MAWCGPVRYYTTISEAVTRDSRNSEKPKKLITASTEAFLVLLYENCHAKWKYIFEEQKKNPKFKYDRKNAKVKALYTEQDGGQKKHGGWKAEGLKRFNELKKAIKEAQDKAYKDQAAVDEAHDDPNTHPPLVDYFQVETDCLAALRKANKKECQDAESEKRRKRKRKKDQADASTENMPEVVETIDFEE